MRAILLLTLFFSAPAFARPGWFVRACDLLLEGRPPAPSPGILKVESDLRGELQRNAKYSQHRYVMDQLPLEYLLQKPVGIEIVPRLNADYLEVRPVDLRIFANPNAIEMQWQDEGKTLAGGPRLILLFDDVPVRAENGETVSIQKLIEQEFTAVLEGNSQLQATMKTSSARAFYQLDFRREFGDYKVMWVEGDISNFQVKRILLLALDHAFTQLSRDPRYVVKKPGPDKTKQ